MKKQVLLVAGLALLTSACANLCESDCEQTPCKKGEVVYAASASSSAALFGFDSAKLSAADESALKDTAARLNDKANADKKVTSNGYASMEGAASYNVDLSRRRAEAVKGYLVKEGVDAKRISVKGHGATDAFGPTYKENRRVEVVVD